jgi:hypothetical protein
MILRNQDVIMVLPNPWTHLDETGAPQGAVLRDFKEDGPGWIGAKRDPKSGKFTFSVEPVKVRATRYTRDRVIRGELMLASPGAASALGIRYVDPYSMLAGARADAIAAFDAQHGAGEWARINEPLPPVLEPAKETKTTAQPPKASRKPSTPQE